MYRRTMTKTSLLIAAGLLIIPHQAIKTSTQTAPPAANSQAQATHTKSNVKRQQKPTTQQNAPTQAPVNVLDAVIDQTQKHLDQVRGYLSTLSSMINDHQIKTIRNRREVLERIKEINYLIQTIQRERFVQVSPDTAVVLMELTGGIMTHMLQALRKELVTLPAFDPAVYVKRGGSGEAITLERLQQMLMRNNIKLGLFSKAVDGAGLRWYNKLYRKVDHVVIAPCNKHFVPKRAVTAATLGTLGTYFWWRFHNESFKNNMPAWLDNFFGPVPEYTPATSHIANDKLLKNFGRIEHIVSLCGLNMLPIFVYFAYTSHARLKDEWDNHLGPWLDKKKSVLVNWLKGGAYLKEAMRAAEEVEEVTFNDLVGLQNVKEELGCIVSYLENPESFDRIHTTPPKGILLIGDTRTGKSHSVKALFGEIGRMLKRLNRKQEFQFLEFTAAEINQYGIAYLLNLVKQHAPCVVFIDEIDLLDLQRKGKNEMLSQFLTCMSGTLDKTDPKNQVILIAATNRPENLDKALRQPGRFGKEIRFEYPPFKDRREFILRKLDKLSLSPQFFDVDKLALETEGASFEALNSLINTSVLKSRLRGQAVSQTVMEEAINEVIYHTVPSDGKDISPREKQILASHFAGYATVLHLLDAGMRLSRVTIRQVMTNIKEEAMGMHLYQKKEDSEEQKRFIYGRVFTHHDFDPINIASREEKIAQICYHVAGTIAEEMLVGSCGYSCHREGLEKAILTAQSITFEGIEPSRWPKHAQRVRFDQALVIVEDCKQRVRKLFEEHKDALVTVAQVLQEQETLSGTDIANIIYAVEHRDEIIANLKRQQEQKAAQAASDAQAEAISREIPRDDLAQEITAG